MKKVLLLCRVGPMSLEIPVKIEGRRWRVESGLVQMMLSLKKNSRIPSIAGWTVEGILVSHAVYGALCERIRKAQMKPESSRVRCMSGEEGDIRVLVEQNNAGERAFFPDRAFGVLNDERTRIFYPFSRELVLDARNQKGQ